MRRKGALDEEVGHPTRQQMSSSKRSHLETSIVGTGSILVRGVGNSDEDDLNTSFRPIDVGAENRNIDGLRGCVGKCFESPYVVKFVNIFSSNLIPDDPAKISGHLFGVQLCLLDIISSQYVVRLCKFLFLTIAFVLIGYCLIRGLKFEHDDVYSISDFFLYDLHLVLLDSILFFFVGRLYKRRGFDSLFPSILPLLFGIILPSVLNETVFQYSFNTYDIMCRWPPEVFFIAGSFLVLGGATFALHFAYCYCYGLLISKMIEIFLTMSIFVFPIMTNDNFHPHHWFIAWVFGMHANQRPWWSQMTIAFLWGYYINGISSYGRDSLLGCLNSYYHSTNQRCYYMDCQIKLDDFWYIDDDCVIFGCDDDYRNQTFTDDGDGPSNTYGSQYFSFQAPKWHQCDAEIS